MRNILCNSQLSARGATGTKRDWFMPDATLITPKSLQSAGTQRVLSVPLELWQPKIQDRTVFADTLRPVEVLPVERSHPPYILM